MQIIPLSSSHITLTESTIYIDRGDIPYAQIIIPENTVCHYVSLLDGHGIYEREFCIAEGSTFSGGAVVYGTDVQYSVTTRILGDNVHAHMQILGLARDNARLDIRGSSIVDAPYRHITTRVDQNNIFLGHGGAIRGMPILEIATDDIEGGHSCRIHRISEEALFYLESHGLDTATAESLLIEAELRKHTSIIGDCDVCEGYVREIRNTIFQNKTPIM